MTTLRSLLKTLACLVVPLTGITEVSGQTPHLMSSGNYTEDFADIANTTNWPNGFNGPSSEEWNGLAVNATGTIPDGVRVSSATTSFVTGSSGGVQRGTENIQLLSTGSGDNSTAVAIDLNLNFTGRNAGTLSFDAATVFNSTGNRAGTLRVYTSADGVTFTELTGGGLPYTAYNNVDGSASITALALPSTLDAVSAAKLRFYYHNGGTPIPSASGSRPKISIDNIVVTSSAADAPPTITTQPAGLTIPTDTSTTLTVVASGSSLNYEWFQGTAPDETTAVGTNSASFTTPALATTTSYWVKVSNTFGNAPSSTATVTVSNAPQVMSVVPADAATGVAVNSTITINFSKPVSLTTTAVTLLDGMTPVAFSGLPASSVSSVVLTPSAPLDYGKTYAVNVVAAQVTDMDSSNPAADFPFSFTTESAVAPAFTLQPQSQTLSSGDPATLTVAVTGTPTPNLLWYAGNTGDESNPLTGETGATLALTSVTMSSSYWVKATNVGGSANSQTAILSIPGPFGAGNFVVHRLGDGVTSLSSAANPISLVEVSPSGAAQQILTTPFTNSNLLTDTGTGTTIGYLGSYAGRLIVPGYNSAVGTSGVANLNTKAVNQLDVSGTVQSRTEFPTDTTIFGGNSFRSAVPDGANGFYATGTGSPTSSGGVWYHDGTDFTRITSGSDPSNLRNVGIYGNQLFFSTGSGSQGVYAYAGVPTSAALATLLLPVPNPYGFYFISTGSQGAGVLDRAWVVSNNTADGTGGLIRFDYDGTSWNKVYGRRIATATNDLLVDNGTAATGTVARGLSGSWDENTGTATLYVTTTETSNNRLVKVIDSGATPTTFTLLQSAGANYVFRGVAPVPEAIPPAAPVLASTTPLNNATEVPINTSITLNFSEPVSLTGSAVTIEAPVGTPVAFSGLPVTTAAQQVVLTPSADLPLGTVVTVTVVGAQVTDANDGLTMEANASFTFTTAGSPPQPDLTVAVAGPATAFPGVNYDYSVTVSNIGTADAAAVAVDFTLPAGVSYVGAGGTGFAVNQTGGVVSFTGGEVATGGSAVLAVTVVAAATGTITVPAGAAVADPANMIVEVSEANNASTEIVTTTISAGPLPFVGIGGNGSFQENFDTLGEGYPQGWVGFKVAGTSAAAVGTVSVPVVGNGGGFSGAIYNLGEIDTAERALGLLASGGFTGALGVSLVNQTASVLDSTQVKIGFTTEQWRTSSQAPLERLVFEWRLGGEMRGVTTGVLDRSGWTTVTEFDIVEIDSGTISGPVNGNDPAFRVVISPAALTGLAGWQPGQVLHLRWIDTDNTGSDAALAIDDFVVVTEGIPEVAPAIVSSPADTQVAPGGTATLTVVASGSTPLEYAWYEGDVGVITTPVGGNFPSFTTPVIVTPKSYWVRVSNGAGAVDSAAAIVSVRDDPFVISTTPANNATAVLLESLITIEFSEPVNVAANGVTIAQGGSPVAFTGLPATGVTSLVLTPSELLTANRVYTVMVVAAGVTDGTTPMQEDLSFSFTSLVPVEITGQPQNLTVMQGQTATFTVTTAGDGPLSYDWRKDGGSLGLESSPTLSLPGVVDVEQGNYSVVVTGPGIGNSVISDMATLTVVSPNDPIVLLGTSYTQDFDGIAAGLPLGWSVRTGASATSNGGVASFNTSPVPWGTFSGNFRNAASATDLTSAAVDGVQAASVNRAPAVRQTGGFGDPGAAFAFTFNTSGKTLTGLSLSLQMLSVQARSTTWSLQLGVGAEPAVWETVAVFTDPGVFGATLVTLTEGDLVALENQPQAWFRVVALSGSSGSGSRDTFGIDDFAMTYEDINPGFFWDANGAVAGAGGATPTGIWGTDAFWSASALGELATAGWTPGEGASFAAGEDAVGSYTVTVDGTQLARAITFEEGTVALSGGILEFTGLAPRVRVLAESATISSEIQGSAGLRKIGAGQLSLTGANTFTGPVAVGGGILSISSDSALGDVGNDLVLNGTLEIGSTLTLPASRSISGQGTLSPAVGTTLTVAGDVSMPTGLTLAGGGDVAFTGSSLALGPLAVTLPIQVTGNELDLTGINVMHASGTTTVANALDFVASTATAFVEEGATLALNAPIKLAGPGANRLIKTGAGTLLLPVANPELNKISVGVQGFPALTGGLVRFGSKDALGTTQAFFNYGTLEPTVPMIGTDALPIGFSIGGREDSRSVLAGESLEVAGNTGLFAAAGTFGDIVLEVNNETRFVGDIAVAATAASIDSLSLKGTGTVILGGVKTGLNKPIKVGGSVTLVLDAEVIGNGTLVGSAGLELEGDATVVVGGEGVTKVVRTYSGLRAAAGTEVRFDVAGTVPGTQYDVLELASPAGGGGAVEFAGLIKVTLTAGYVPAAGDSFQLLRAATGMTVEAGGATFDLPELEAPLVWNTSAFATTGALLIFAPGAPPTILSQPQSQEVVAGVNVVFSVSAFAEGTLSYDWRKNGVSLEAPNQDTLVMNNVSVIDAGIYSVVVSGLNGSTPSNDALLTVVGPPVITVPPQSAAVVDDTPVTFAVTAFGSGTLSYQWQFNEVDIADAIAPTLEIIASPATHGRYRVIVSNDLGPLTSATALLSGPSAGPPNQRPEWPEVGDLPDGQIGLPYSFRLAVLPDDPASNVLRSADTFRATGLPAGLRIDSLTGEITGIPAAIKATPYAVTVTARNSFGTAILRTRLLIQPLPSGALGVFTGPVERSTILADVAPFNNGPLGGRFDMTVAATGRATGSVTIGVRRYAFRSALVIQPTLANRASLTAAIKRGRLSDVVINLTVDTLNGTITEGTVSDGTTTTEFTGWRNPWSRLLQPATSLTGLYTTKLELTDGALTSEQAPQGSGFLSFTVNQNTGRLSLRGRLADGSVITMATFAGPAGQILLFRPLYAGAARGSVLGQLGIVAEPDPLDNTVDGDLEWFRPANGARANRLYRAGFPGDGVVDVEVTGSRYQVPTPRNARNPAGEPRVMGLTDAANEIEVFLTGGGVETALPLMPEIMANVALNNRVTFNPDFEVNTRRMVLSFVARTGTFTGRFTLRDNNPTLLPVERAVVRTVAFQGLIVDGVAEGYFIVNQLPAVAGDTPANTAQQGGKVLVQPVVPIPL